MIMKQALFLVLVALPIAASAHHSRAEFAGADDTRELEGELVEVRWSNPHPRFSLRTVSETGQEEVWYLEAYGNAAALQRTGVLGEHFTVGEPVRVVGRVSNRRDYVMLTTNMLLSDGTEAILEYHGDPHWSEEHIGGAETWVIDDEAVLRRAAEENRGIFRVWSIRRRGLDSEHLPFTEEALAAQAVFDPLSSFLTQCVQPGMPMTMMRPHRYEFVDQGESILMRGQYFDTERTIHMADAENPEDQPLSHLGYSVGRWEGNTLIVETNRINWPNLDPLGTRQSEAMHTVERFTLSQNQSRLDYHLTMTDPVAFTEPATYEIYWLALGEAVLAYDCVPG